MRNMSVSETELLDAAVEALRDVLPPAWTVKIGREPAIRRGSRAPADAIVRLRAPDGNEAVIVLEAKSKLDARDVPSIVKNLRALAEGLPFVVAPYLGRRTREILQQQGAGYLDMTGNLRFVLDRPAVLIQREGATRNPSSEQRPLHSLKGPGSGRAVRALCEFRPPFGIRELAVRAGISPATIVRVVELLDREAIVVRKPRGSVERVDWKLLIQRWAQDYDSTQANRPRQFLEPRGLQSLVQRLKDSSVRYAITASLAATEVAPVSPPKLARVFVESIEQAAKTLELRQAETAGNVVLAEPYDDVVFERTWQKSGTTFAALPQVAVDLLTGPGREPSDGEALLKWMEGNERAWRA